MARQNIDSFEGFYDALTNLDHKSTLAGRLDITLRCLGPELPYVKHMNGLFHDADHMIIRFDTKMVQAEKPDLDAPTIKVKVFDRYYFHLYRHGSDVPFSIVKFNYINPWEYISEDKNPHITTETVSDKVPVRIDIRNVIIVDVFCLCILLMY